MRGMTDTLRRIDREIDSKRQQIAILQVEIMRLEDSRKVFMQLAEDDEARARQPGSAELLPGATARPMLIVRKAGSGDEEPKKKRRKKRVHTGGKRPDANSELGRMRSRILSLVKPGEEPMSGSEIGNHLGLASTNDARKPMQNALYYMRTKGMLFRDDAKRYYRPAANGAH